MFSFLTENKPILISPDIKKVGIPSIETMIQQKRSHDFVDLGYKPPQLKYSDLYSETDRKLAHAYVGGLSLIGLYILYRLL